MARAAASLPRTAGSPSMARTIPAHPCAALRAVLARPFIFRHPWRFNPPTHGAIPGAPQLNPINTDRSGPPSITTQAKHRLVFPDKYNKHHKEWAVHGPF